MRIVLISDDADFFEYIAPKLILRKSDELYRFSFDALPEKLHLVLNSVLIMNSENSENKTLELLKLIKGTPSFVFAYNENTDFKIQVYKSGALGYITMFTSDEELQAKLLPALNVASNLEKNTQYREMLVRNNLLTANNEVFLNYIAILDKELEKLSNCSASAVLAAISPNDKTKFLLQPNQIETHILNNIRKNDILMSYAANKYFLLLFDTDIPSAQKIWEKIRHEIPEKIYAGFSTVTPNKKREQLVNEVLNKLHEAINYDKDYIINTKNSNLQIDSGNFKLYRKEFYKKMQNIITPVFYQVQQKYNNKLFGMIISQSVEEGAAILTIKGREAFGTFKITMPGLSKINIDIIYQKGANTDSKRINLEPDEFEGGVLEDLLEQFIIEFKKEINDDNT